MSIADLLLNWKSLAVVAAISAAITGSAAYKLHNLDVERIERKHEKALEAKGAEDAKKCLEEKNVTKEVANGLQRKNTALARELVDTKLMYARAPAPKCVPLALAAVERHGAAPGGELPVGDEEAARLAADAFIDYAGSAEQTRLKLLGCQSFIEQVWKLNGQ